MIRLLIWCAFGVLALFAMIKPIYAVTTDIVVPHAWAVPNLFGTVALQVSQTPYDAKWRHAWLGNRGPISTLDERRATTAFRDLAMVQRDVNHRVSYRADSSQLGGGDIWSTAADTLARGSGDCEDYAIAKGQSLLALGFLPQDLYLVIGNDLILRSAHAILVVRVGPTFWVLDNLSNQVIEANLFRDFSPLITLSADRKWVHGESGARRRLIHAQTRSIGLPTDPISAVKVAQSAFRTARLSNP